MKIKMRENYNCYEIELGIGGFGFAFVISLLSTTASRQIASAANLQS